MEYVKSIIDRYKHLRSLRQLGEGYRGMYAFVGIGNHSTSNLYPVLSYLHVPLKYIGCKSHDKLPLIERAYPGVKATTSLAEILSDDEVKGVFVSIAPEAHFDIGIKVLESGSRRKEKGWQPNGGRRIAETHVTSHAVAQERTCTGQ